jgi:hypothetical protein
LDAIRLIDATDRAMGGGVSHVEFSFAAQTAQHSALTGTLPSSGIVKAKLCADCGRIFLYSTSSSGGMPRRKD